MFNLFDDYVSAAFYSQTLNSSLSLHSLPSKAFIRGEQPSPAATE